MPEYTDQDIFRKVSTLLQNIDQNQQVQQAAYENGIDVKNSTRLTAATKDNLAVSVIALLLAKRNNDPRCKDLVDYGLKHRTTKVDIINDYKAEANALITRYRNGERPEPEEIQISISTESYLDDDYVDVRNEYYVDTISHVFQEGVGKVIAGVAAAVVVLPIVLVTTAIGIIIKLIQSFIGLFTRISPKRLLKKLEKIPAKDRRDFTFKIDLADSLAISIGHSKFMEIYEEFSAFTDEFAECVETDNITKDLREKAQKLIDKCDSLSQKRSGDASLQHAIDSAVVEKQSSQYSRYTYMTYDKCVEWLKELEKFDMSTLRDKNSKLQKCLAKLQLKNAYNDKDEVSKSKTGLTDSDIDVLRKSTLECVGSIQSYILGQNRMLRKADIDFDFKATYDESVEKHHAERKKKELEEKQDEAVRKAQQAKDDKEFEDSLAQAHELTFYFGYKPESAIKRAEQLRDDLKKGWSTGYSKIGGSYTVDKRTLEMDRRAMLRAASDLAKRDPETAKKIADILKDA